MKLIEQIYNKFKAGAVERNLQFDLTIEQLVGLLYGQDFKCYLTKELFIVNEIEKKQVINIYCLKDVLEVECTRHTTKFRYNCSIDRVDNSKGYTIDNVKFCTKRINMFKKDYNLKEFLEMCKTVSNYAY